MFEWVFLSSINEVIALTLILLIAGVVRGAIGFASSALIVASSSFWLPPQALAGMVAILEIVASLFMWKSVRHAVQTRILFPLLLTTVPFSLLGVWLLANTDQQTLRIIIGVYMLLVAIVALFDIKLPKGKTGSTGLAFAGVIAGLYNGLALVGGIFLATFLTASQVSVSQIRATLSIFILLTDVIFFTGAILNDIYRQEIVVTALLAIIPMMAGIIIGTYSFNKLPEQALRKAVLIVLVLISGFGLYKTLFLAN